MFNHGFPWLKRFEQKAPLTPPLNYSNLKKRDIDKILIPIVYNGVKKSVEEIIALTRLPRLID
jgi:hypothetical protein